MSQVIATNSEISRAAAILQQGGLVAFPTETVYGLGANALNPIAVAAIFEAKQRPSFDPLIVHIAEMDSLAQVAVTADTRVFDLAQAFWPGPLTIILPKSDLIPDIVTSGLPDVAVRMPGHPVALELIRQAGFPLAAPSANRFGKLSPVKASHVKKQLPDVSCVLDGGDCTVGLESTVIKILDDGFAILRHGAITSLMLSKVLPESKRSYENMVLEASPGMMKSHYSPEKCVYLIGIHPLPKDISEGGLITFIPKVDQGFKLQRHLSQNGDLREAAVNLFGLLHEMEEAEVQFIAVETVPETGIGIAVMDRLLKASYRFHTTGHYHE